MNALQIAASGMGAQQMRVEVISNNLANMNTTAYNARRAEFADLMYQQVQAPGSAQLRRSANALATVHSADRPASPWASVVA